MIGHLPKALEVGGRLIPINTDFRVILSLFPMFDDPELTNQEKAYITCLKLYQEAITLDIFTEATTQAYKFIDGGDLPKTEPEKTRIIDWEKDERIIIPAVSKTVGVVDVRELPYMHWWTFLGALGEVGDGMFSMVMHLRRKQAEGKLEKWEKDYIRKHEDLICLRTPEEEAELQELNDFLATII